MKKYFDIGLLMITVPYMIMGWMLEKCIIYMVLNNKIILNVNNGFIMTDKQLLAFWSAAVMLAVSASASAFWLDCEDTTKMQRIITAYICTVVGKLYSLMPWWSLFILVLLGLFVSFGFKQIHMALNESEIKRLRIQMTLLEYRNFVKRNTKK